MGRSDGRGLFWEDIEANKLPRLPGSPKVKAERSSGPKVARRVFAPPESAWTPPSDLPRIPLGTIVAVDCETKEYNLDLFGPSWPLALRYGDDYGWVAGVSLDYGEGARYYPLRHPDTTPLVEPHNVIAWLRDHISGWNVVFHNLPYDAGWLSTLGVDVFSARGYDDTFAMDCLLDEHSRAHSLDAVAQRVGHTGKDEGLLKSAGASFGFTDKEVKANLWQLPARYVGPYAEEDASATLAAYRALRPRISAEDMDRVYELERDQWPVLYDMRKRGVRVDLDARDALQVEWTALAKQYQQTMDDAAGQSISPWAAQAISSVCDRLGIAYGRTETGEPSFKAAWLRSHDHPFIHALANLRELSKMHGTFLGGYFGKLVVDGRLYGNFHALAEDDSGTISGRYASSKPNLQNIPSRNKLYGPQLRRLLLPDEGRSWIRGDYNQQEPRLLVHYAYICKCTGASGARTAYLTNPRTDFHQWTADTCGLERERAKPINLGVTYGMGEVALCKNLGLPTEWIKGRDGKQREVAGVEGKRIMRQYHEHIPFVREMTDLSSNRAKRRKKVVSLGGRVLHFPPHIGPHAALNRIVQSSAADMVKLAMPALHKAGFEILNSVHDEIGSNHDDDPTRLRAFKDIMEGVMDLSVPIVSDVTVGTSWGDAKR